MGYNNMLTYSVRLEAQPGGIMPELHLKRGMTSAMVKLLVPPGNTLVNASAKQCVLKAALPDGTELFATGFSQMEERNVCVNFYSATVRKMCAAEGSYKCTLTILDTNRQVTRTTYSNQEFLTVLPFAVTVHKSA